MPRSPVNKLCPCGSEKKYKRCYRSNIPIKINSTKIPIYKEVLAKLPPEYYNYIDVFNREKVNKLLPHRTYDYKLEFTEDREKIGFLKSRIYPILGYKLK